MINMKLFILYLTLSILFISGIADFTNGQNKVIVIVMDGAGWIKTFGGGAAYIPNLYNEMRPNGTLYTDFRIDYNAGAQTLTNPGHATIETGTWQTILNDGTQRPTFPTIFEYYRKQSGADENTCYVITGKSKLSILNYSTYPDYGQTFGGSWLGDNWIDSITFASVDSIMSTKKPNLLLVNFAEVDRAGDSGDSVAYNAAIINADNYIYQIWQHIQNGDYGYDTTNTTLFITNDHGRNDTLITEHGDGCEGCTHIMLLALGRNVVPQEISNTTYQRDIAPTVGDLLGFTTPFATGTSLFEYSDPLPVELTSFTANANKTQVDLKWQTSIEVNNYGFEIERKLSGNWQKIGFVQGNGNSNSPKGYTHTDKNLGGGSKFQYRLKQIDNDGKFEYSNEVEIFLSPTEFAIYQNYPNPFNSSTTIKYQVPFQARRIIKVI